MIRFILLDIEGTTSDIHFVHKVLFPYSAERLPDYVRANRQEPLVEQAMAAVKQTIADEQGRTIDDAEAIHVLLGWIQEDRKHTALKQLQGAIWQQGFEHLHFQAHVYDDVPRALQNWKLRRLGMGIYSSGSVQAQKLFFGYSVSGDLSSSFSHYFDTQVGGKKEVDSYRKILETLQLAPMEVLFLSDVEGELDAARLAGLRTIQVVREGTVPSKKHDTVTTLLGVEIPESEDSKRISFY